MANYTGLNFQRIVPHATIPGLIQPVVENIEWQMLFAEKTHYGSEGLEALYANKLTAYSTASKVAGASTWSDDNPTPTASFGQTVAPYYRIRSRFIQDKITEAKFSKMNFGVSQEQLGFTLAKQGIYQRKALGAIYGYDPSKNQGLAANVGVSIPMPNDSETHGTVVTYLPNELYAFLISQIREMLNISYGKLKPVIIASSWRVIHYLQTSIVPLGAYQVNGGGTASVAQVMQNVIDPIMAGMFRFVPMSFLQAQNPGDPDRMYIVSPGLSESEAEETISPMNKIPNNIYANTMYDEVFDILTETNPTIDGITSTNVYSLLSIPIVTRKEAIREITMIYQ